MLPALVDLVKRAYESRLTKQIVPDASIVNVAAPSIHATLRASGAGLQLVVAGYLNVRQCAGL
jgi:hypothetical protein